MRRVMLSFMPLIVLFFIIEFTLIWLLVVKVQNSLIANLRTTAVEQNQQSAEKLAGLFKNEIETLTSKLLLIAQIDEIQTNDPKTCSAKLKTLIPLVHGKFNNLGRLDKKGIVSCSTDARGLGLNRSTQDHIKKIYSDSKHTPVLSRIVVSPTSGKSVLSLVVPVYNKKGEFDGVANGSIELTQIEQKYLSGVNRVSKGYPVLIDDDGQIIYHPQKQLINHNITSPDLAITTDGKDQISALVKNIYQVKPGSIKYKFQDDEKYASYAPIDVIQGRRWAIIMTMEAATIDEQVNKSSVATANLQTFQYLFFNFIALTFLFTFLRVGTLFYNLLRPMKTMHVFLTKGEPSMSSQMLARDDEIGDIARGIDRLADKKK